MIKIIPFLVLLSGCSTFAPYDWPKYAFDNELDWAAYQVPKGINCLDYALQIQQLVPEAEIITIEHYPLNHALVCKDEVCVDNGTLSSGYFARTDLDHYKIIKAGL